MIQTRSIKGRFILKFIKVEKYNCIDSRFYLIEIHRYLDKQDLLNQKLLLCRLLN